MAQDITNASTMGFLRLAWSCGRCDVAAQSSTNYYGVAHYQIRSAGIERVS